jgi:TPR repeat protein
MAQELPTKDTLMEWRERAEEDDAYAMYMLGYYHAVLEEYPDLEKALEWFRKSAEKGYVHAEYTVGYSYLEGKGTEQNPKEGIKWIKLAARHRSPDAICVLAMLHLSGTYEEVKKDPREGFRLLKQAANLNSPEANTLLGSAYFEDCDWETVDAAYKQQVVRLMTRAANQGDITAQNFLAGLYAMDCDETIPQNLEKSFELISKAAQNHEPLVYHLAGYRLFGYGCEADVPGAIDLFMSSEKPPYQSELMTLACCFLLDDVVKQDDKDMLAKMEQTVEWLKEESEDGNTIAKTFLEAGYQAEKTGKEDVQKIADQLQTLADQGDADAMYLLGTFENIGVGRERNREKFFTWMQRAAEKEHAEAERVVGSCLMTGFGTKRNIRESREFLKRAAEHGSAEAREHDNIRRQWEQYLGDLRPSLFE